MAIDLLTNFSTAVTKTTAVTGVSGAASATIACWYYGTTVAGGFDPVLRLSGTGGTDTMAQLYTFSDTTFNWSSDDGTFENLVQQAFVVNQWHHYALVYTQTAITAYYDGASIGSASHTFGSRASQIQIVLGPCQGYVQDALVYSAALSASDIGDLFRKRTPSRTANLIAWYPCFSNARTTDFGPNKWDLTETGTIAGAPVDAPAVWAGQGRLNFLRQAAATAIDGSGNVSVSGSAAISEAVAFTGSGQSSVSASATISVATALVGTGQSSVSASATGKEAAALSGTGASSVSGSAAVSEAVALTGSGQTSVSGTGTLASGSLTGSGDTSVSGTGALSEAAALTGAGNVAVAGSAAVSQLLTIAGTGASSVSATGTVSRQLQLVGSGDCAVAGSAAVSVSYALTGTGQVSVSGAASFAGAPGTAGVDEQPVDRRWTATLGSRRRVRR